MRVKFNNNIFEINSVIFEEGTGNPRKHTLWLYTAPLKYPIGTLDYIKFTNSSMEAIHRIESSLVHKGFIDFDSEPDFIGYKNDLTAQGYAYGNGTFIDKE